MEISSIVSTNHNLRTFLSTTQWCSNFFTCCSFPFRNRPGLSNRCISASFGCRMRRIGFFTHFQDQLCPLPSKLHAWSSCCSAPCLHRTTVATQAIGALHIIPFLRDCSRVSTFLVFSDVSPSSLKMISTALDCVRISPRHVLRWRF